MMDLPQWFAPFLAPRADRCEALVLALEAGGVGCRVLELSGGRFVVAWPKGSTHDPRYRVKVVTAHHDRVPGTPGALDNSAACLQLVDFLSSGRPAFNTLVVFTDHEELGSRLSPAAVTQAATAPSDQGSYELGRAFPGMGLRAPMVFPLDVTGRGDALILSLAAHGLAGRRGHGGGSSALGALVAETDDMANTISKLMAGRAPLFRAMVPFGEDLGFILAGVPALAVTVLPRDEADALASLGGLPAWSSPVAPGLRTPETWSQLHGPNDTPALYTASAFKLVARFLDRLSALRVPAPVSSSPYYPAPLA
ncbi:MAG: hypothetical protein A2Y38_02520 [Spirochaetes bacterium GWB1_59_5]|nr:MAG: hypothetical protein A2Y38_02520 [Spirochaetes bacterium GWB1_59_5]